MALNVVFIAFFLAGIIIAFKQAFYNGNDTILSAIVDSTFTSSKTGFEISIGLTGALCLWMGIMKIGENGGAVKILTRFISPLFSRLFPDIPKDHPAQGSIMLNFSANMLGLDNAATPAGLKAMQELQELNTDKESASRAQIMFLVLNTSGLTLIPVSIMAIRGKIMTAQGITNANPTDIFIPILIATFFSTLGGLLLTSAIQKIKFDKVILAYILGACALVGGLIYYTTTLEPEELKSFSTTLGSSVILSIILSFILMAAFKKVNVFESFIDGAKDGFSTAIKIIPYLIGILVAISVFRASGGLDFIMIRIESLFAMIFPNTAFVDALPTAIMKPLSGKASQGLMVETMNTHGATSFAGTLSSMFQGSADTTFYIIAVYFGSVGIRKTKYALAAGLFADLCGVIAAIITAYLFFG